MFSICQLVYFFSGNIHSGNLAYLSLILTVAYNYTIRPDLGAMAIKDTGLWITLVNEINFGTNHATGAVLIAQPADLQSNVIPLCYSCPLTFVCGLMRLTPCLLMAISSTSG